MRSLSCFLILVVLCAVPCAAFAKDAPRKNSDYKFTESPQPPSNPLEIGGSIFQGAAANTVTLGWWQFDGPGGSPDKQGWTEHDLSSQAATYFHVAGSSGGCDAITPVSGTKSMWCGRWSAAGEPWCGWVALPGYGNYWDQSLVATVTASSVTYSIRWESESGYDFTYVEWWDSNSIYWNHWVADPSVNGSAGKYDGSGGPQTETSVSPFGPTRFRFHFVSDEGWSDEDGLAPTAEGAVQLDDLSIDGGPVEDWEVETCGAGQSADGKWVASITTPFGSYAALHHGSTLVQEDPCVKERSWLWGFFDDPASTNYACGGWPLQGAVPYARRADAMYLDNEIWSPWVPNALPGSATFLEFRTYRDLKDDTNMIAYVWHVRTRDLDAGGCPTPWRDHKFWYYGGQEDWYRAAYDASSYIPVGTDEIQVALGARDLCGAAVWCSFWGMGNCHSHAPLFDQVRLVQVPRRGPLWTVRDIDLWQDTFPENGGIGPGDYARCDMAQDIIPLNKKRICPGDSLKVVVTDPGGFAADNTGGRPGKAVYVFVKVTDRFGNTIAGKNGLALQSPDDKAWASDPNSGLLRWPFVMGVAPAGWDAYRMDYSYTSNGSKRVDTYCVDLMDISAFLTDPSWHPNENKPANTGVFAAGDVVQYFFGAKNAFNQWSYWTRSLEGQSVGCRTENIAEATANSCEWSVLPDAGRLPGDQGDILFVDDADDRGGPAQLYFDWAFELMNMGTRVDRFDVLGPSSMAGNSLASRVKNVQTQIVGQETDGYKIVLWNTSDLSRGLMGDGGTPNGGSSAEKSDDFGLCYAFLNTSPHNPGWAYWGDDVVQDWNTLVGLGAVNVKSTFMNHASTNGNQFAITGVVNPKVLPPSPLPPTGYLQPTESFYANGGCPAVNDFDVPGQSGLSRVSCRYNDSASGATAALSQPTPNAAGSTARFFLAGFGYNFTRDDDLDQVPDYVKHLQEILAWFGVFGDNATGIDPVAFANRLENAYPNPFNPTTTIRYSIASAGHVSLSIYNVAGQLVRTLIDEDQVPTAEGFSVTWDGRNNGGQDVASGVYFHRLAAKGFSDTKKMVLLR